MQLHQHGLYHVYNRGNNRNCIFYDSENYPYFLSKIRKWIVPNCDILAYTLMPNHFHMLVHANEWTAIPYQSMGYTNSTENNPGVSMSRFSHGIQILLSSYTKAMNKRYHRTGSLFDQNTRARKTSSDTYMMDYSLWCFLYIHNNPVKAGLVTSPEKWQYSSYHEYLGLARNPICNLALGRKLLDLDRNDWILPKGCVIPDEIVVKLFK